MAGYSGTPLAKKLGVKPGHRVALVDAPDGFVLQLEGLPENVMVTEARSGSARFDVIVAYFRSRANLIKQFNRLGKRLTPAGGLWIAWPKALGLATDLSEGVVRELGLETGLVDNKVCAIDETWSGLRFVIRLVDRPQKSVEMGGRRNKAGAKR